MAIGFRARAYRDRVMRIWRKTNVEFYVWITKVINMHFSPLHVVSFNAVVAVEDIHLVCKKKKHLFKHMLTTTGVSKVLSYLSAKDV